MSGIVANMENMKEDIKSDIIQKIEIQLTEEVGEDLNKG